MFIKPRCAWGESRGSGMHQWIKQKENPHPSEVDVILYGSLLSDTDDAMTTAQYPNAFRKAWPDFQSYNLDEQINLRALSVVDVGDVAIYPTDNMLSQSAVEAAAESLCMTYPKSFTCLIGGDHSMTACSLRGIKNAYPQERIGIIQFDTHLDIRKHKEIGMRKKSPVHQVMEDGIIEGRHMYQVGLHGFFNSPEMIHYAREQGIHMITLKQMRRDGLQLTIREMLRQLMYEVDRIYVSVDMDVLDSMFVPGVPGAAPGGLTAHELFDIVKLIGENAGVRHLDFVCADSKENEFHPTTVKTGITAFLNWVTGIQLDNHQRIQKK